MKNTEEVKKKVKGSVVITIGLWMLGCILCGGISSISHYISLPIWITMISYFWKKADAAVQKASVIFDMAVEKGKAAVEKWKAIRADFISRK